MKLGGGVPRLREFRWDSWADWTAKEIVKDAPEVIALDTETSGVSFYDEPFGSMVTWRAPNGSLKSGYIEMDDDLLRPIAGAGVPPAGDPTARLQRLASILNTVDVWAYHNSKFDLQKYVLMGVLSRARLDEIELHDTQTLWTLIDENSRKGLKHLAVTVLGVDDTIEVEIKSGPNKGKTKRVPKEEYRLAAVRRKLKLKKEDGYHLLPREVLIPYALKDTEFTLQLFETLMPRLEAIGDPRLLDLYREFMELKLVLLDMEADGFKLNMDYLNEVTSDYGVRVMEGWEKIVSLTGNPELNPQSPAQLIEAFAARGVPLESTAESVLKGVQDELAQDLIQYRSDAKVYKTYLKALVNEQREGIIHPSFNDDAARTGRMSSSTAFNN